jgi:muconolactone delta-isomerase
MKFLMLSTLLTEVPPPEDFPAAIQAVREYLDAALVEGTLDCIYMFANGRESVLIANADSHEELCDWLQRNPAYPYWDYEIRPLVNLHHYLDTLVK